MFDAEGVLGDQDALDVGGAFADTEHVHIGGDLALDEARDLLPSRIDAVAKDTIEKVPGLAKAKRGKALGDGWHEYTLTVPPEGDAGAVLEHCTANGVPLRQFAEQRASLHEVFVQLVGDEGVER